MAVRSSPWKAEEKDPYGGICVRGGGESGCGYATESGSYPGCGCGCGCGCDLKKKSADL